MARSWHHQWRFDHDITGFHSLNDSAFDLMRPASFTHDDNDYLDEDDADEDDDADANEDDGVHRPDGQKEEHPDDQRKSAEATYTEPQSTPGTGTTDSGKADVPADAHRDARPLVRQRSSKTKTKESKKQQRAPGWRSAHRRPAALDKYYRYRHALLHHADHSLARPGGSYQNHHHFPPTSAAGAPNDEEEEDGVEGDRLTKGGGAHRDVDRSGRRASSSAMMHGGGHAATIGPPSATSSAVAVVVAASAAKRRDPALPQHLTLQHHHDPRNAAPPLLGESSLSPTSVETPSLAMTTSDRQPRPLHRADLLRRHPHHHHHHHHHPPHHRPQQHDPQAHPDPSSSSTTSSALATMARHASPASTQADHGLDPRARAGRRLHRSSSAHGDRSSRRPASPYRGSVGQEHAAAIAAHRRRSSSSRRHTRSSSLSKAEFITARSPGTDASIEKQEEGKVQTDIAGSDASADKKREDEQEEDNEADDDEGKEAIVDESEADAAEKAHAVSDAPNAASTTGVAEKTDETGKRATEQGKKKRAKRKANAQLDVIGLGIADAGEPLLVERPGLASLVGLGAAAVHASRAVSAGPSVQERRVVDPDSGDLKNMKAEEEEEAMTQRRHDQASQTPLSVSTDLTALQHPSDRAMAHHPKPPIASLVTDGTALPLGDAAISPMKITPPIRPHMWSPRDKSPTLHDGPGGWQLGLTVGEGDFRITSAESASEEESHPQSGDGPHRGMGYGDWSSSERHHRVPFSPNEAGAAPHVDPLAPSGRASPIPFPSTTSPFLPAAHHLEAMAQVERQIQQQQQQQHQQHQPQQPQQTAVAGTHLFQARRDAPRTAMIPIDAPASSAQDQQQDQQQNQRPARKDSFSRRQQMTPARFADLNQKYQSRPSPSTTSFRTSSTTATTTTTTSDTSKGPAKTEEAANVKDASSSSGLASGLAGQAPSPSSASTATSTSVSTAVVATVDDVREKEVRGGGDATMSSSAVSSPSSATMPGSGPSRERFFTTDSMVSPTPSESSAIQSPAMSFLASFGTSAVNMGTSSHAVLSGTSGSTGGGGGVGERGGERSAGGNGGSSGGGQPTAGAMSGNAGVVVSTRPPNWVGEQVGPYVVGRMLGYGAFSEVHECFAIDPQDGHTTKLAVKIIGNQKQDTEMMKMLEKEIAMWSSFDHAHICRFVDVITTNDCTFLFSEKCDFHLLDYIRERHPIGEKMAALIFRQLAAAVHYLHETKGIVHRDLKPENVLLVDDTPLRVKLTDFGLSDYIPTAMLPASFQGGGSHAAPPGAELKSPSGSMTNLSPTDLNAATDPSTQLISALATGSLMYCSPEELEHSPSALMPSADVWSLGVTLYAMLAGDLPFVDDFLPRLQMHIIKGEYRPLSSDVSEEAKDLVQSMLCVRVSQRITTAKIMTHPWLAKWAET